MKIGIVGMGSVGSSIATAVLSSGLAEELLLADVNHDRAEGEAMDLAQGAAFYPSAIVRSASVDAMRDADAVVIAAGRGGRPEQSRLSLLQENAQIVCGIARQLADTRGLIVIVTNPVDVLTQLAVKASGLPATRVIGTGTMLDTARLRQILGRNLHLEPRSIHAQVVGEHGDSEVVLWSSAQIGGTPLRALKRWHVSDEALIAKEVRDAAYEIIRRKGATNHAIGYVTAALLRWALRGDQRVLTVSRMQEGAHGIHDVALSLPTLVGPKGATEVLDVPMDEAEHNALVHSAETLRKAVEEIGSV